MSLVQELEAFASSDSLSDLLSLSDPHTLTLLTTLSARGWKKLSNALEIKEEESIESLCRRSTCATTVIAAEKVMFGVQLSKVVEDPPVEVTGEDGGKKQRLFFILYPSPPFPCHSLHRRLLSNPLSIPSLYPSLPSLHPYPLSIPSLPPSLPSLSDPLTEDEDAAALVFVNEWLGAIADSGEQSQDRYLPLKSIYPG